MSCSSSRVPNLQEAYTGNTTVCISAAIIIIALSLALKTKIRNFMNSPKGPKAQWRKLGGQQQDQKDKPDRKVDGNEHNGQPRKDNSVRNVEIVGEGGKSERSSAYAGCYVFDTMRGARASRKKQSPTDVESSIAMQDLKDL